MKNPSPRLIRLIAFSDWVVAFLVGVPSAGGLYTVWSGQYHNSNWVDPTVFARGEAWGLLLCAACTAAGTGLWHFHRWSRWLETLLRFQRCTAHTAVFFSLRDHSLIVVCFSGCIGRCMFGRAAVVGPRTSRLRSWLLA